MFTGKQSNMEQRKFTVIDVIQGHQFGKLVNFLCIDGQLLIKLEAKIN